MRKKSSKWIAIMVLLFCSISESYSQKDVNIKQDKAYQVLPYLSYGYELSMGDLKDRFGNNFAVHGGLDFLFKNNMTAGMFVKFKFGDNLKEDVLSILRLENGEILGSRGSYANVVMNQRGLYAGLQVGKIFPFKMYGSNFGLKLDIGGGYLSHYVYIDNAFEDVPQLIGDLTKGYDRLSNGLGLNQSIAFHFVADNNYRLFLSLESIQGFTSLARNIQYDFEFVPRTKRIDIFTGIHIGFVMPFGVGSYGEEVYY